MEEHEEQELEFWRKLHERDLSRAQMLKRSPHMRLFRTSRR